MPPTALEFLTERHLATLTLLRPDGSPQVTPIGMTWDADAALARVITWVGSQKAKILERTGGGRAAVCQVDGGRWITLEGDAVVTGDPERAAEGVRRYTERYSPPRRDRGPDRRVIEIRVDRVIGSNSVIGS
ncbi:MAG: TIGR03618 family F420-dependent PPOX class oxidoreductase [Actinomycetota bacterium]